MSYEDPWATAPADAPADEAQAAPASAPATVTTAATAAVDSVSVQHSTDGVSATFKFAGAYSDPWVVVKGADPADVYDKISTPEFKALMDRVQQIAGVYAGSAAKPAGNAGGGGGQQRQAAPKQAQQAPNGEKRFCEHGEMEFKSGVSKAGNAYQLFSCTAPRDQQCKAQYLNNKK
ncbi:hypothetical protein SEA_LUCHADOR_54 [Mycobacterium phage Luchador]|uniref:Uncharacterized protein n=1 Tax=Mycobacterium phage Luchador TaxID=1647300 RepID=A0A0F6YQ36_9CAUD|nr:ribonucleoside reductase class II [Mycobacterium phage Luchador]AKF14218.1 hypothetical protein SEA_LUCHADOR_54 [Mycobacterium phage Luchador]